jgi:hypothetical protein
LGAQKCHGANDAQGARTDIFWKETDTWALDCDGDAESSGDVCRGNAGPTAGRKAKRRKWWGRTDRILESKSFDSADDALSSTGQQVWTATASEADDFALDTIFLVGKGEADKGGGVEIEIEVGAGKAVVADEELDVLEQERGDSGLVLTVYPPGRHRKKKTRQIMVATAQLEMIAAARARLRKEYITMESGIGLTRAGGGSDLA